MYTSTFQKLHACVATASRGHANHTRVTRVRHTCHTRGPFKLWVICTVHVITNIPACKHSYIKINRLGIIVTYV